MCHLKLLYKWHNLKARKWIAPGSDLAQVHVCIFCPSTQLLATAVMASPAVCHSSHCCPASLAWHPAHPSQATQEAAHACADHLLSPFFWMFLWNCMCSSLEIWNSGKILETLTIRKPAFKCVRVSICCVPSLSTVEKPRSQEECTISSKETHCCSQYRTLT